MESRHYVPAAPGQIVYLVTCCPNAGARPCSDDVFAETYPVVAWRITTIDYKVPVKDHERAEFVAPVLIDSFIAADEGLWYPLPDGRLRRVMFDDGPEVAADLDQARALTLAEAQALWDCEHAEQPALIG
jgi:hypothetical protein